MQEAVVWISTLFFLGSVFPKISFASIVALSFLVVKFCTCGHLWQNFFKFFSLWSTSNFECINWKLGFKMLRSTISIRLCDNEINIQITNLWKFKSIVMKHDYSLWTTTINWHEIIIYLVKLFSPSLWIARRPFDSHLFSIKQFSITHNSKTNFSKGSFEIVGHGNHLRKRVHLCNIYATRMFLPLTQNYTNN